MKVMSGDDGLKMITKLGVGMMEQLHFAQNKNNTIASVKGFYFHLGDGYVEEATLTWKDNNFYFISLVKSFVQMP